MRSRIPQTIYPHGTRKSSPGAKNLDFLSKKNEKRTLITFHTGSVELRQAQSRRSFMHLVPSSTFFFLINILPLSSQGRLKHIAHVECIPTLGQPVVPRFPAVLSSGRQGRRGVRHQAGLCVHGDGHNRRKQSSGKCRRDFPAGYLKTAQKMVFLHFGGTFPVTDKRETIPREASLFFTE